MEIYLDNAATTKVDSEVAKKVQEFFVDEYGNASSLHSVGRRAEKELKKAREKIAEFVGCDMSAPKGAPSQIQKKYKLGQTLPLAQMASADADKVGKIIFTSGGTESNNLALRGLAKANPDKKHIITSVIEHPSILETCKDLEAGGYKVDYVKVDSEGIVDVAEIENKICEDTLAVSVMQVNNEIGTIQPVEEIGAICKKAGVYFHTDAVQGFTKVDLALDNIDLFSVSGHKIHAPKGVGFLYIKKGTKISAIMTGGGQENNLRSGTENVPGIIGLATALEINDNKDEIKKSRNKIAEGLLKIPGTKINGSMDNRVYHNINVSFYGIEGESLMLMLDKDGICVSTGSACASTKLKESYVLKAIGVEDLYIHGSLRLTLGGDVVGNEDYVIERIRNSVEKLRKISPFKFKKINGEVKNGKRNDT